MLAEKIISFLHQLRFNVDLPAAISVMNPFEEAAAQKASASFYKKFYNDNNPRYCIIGINPGRFGGGITGIPFTDPIRLQNACKIDNDFIKKQELSSVFIYEMIEAFGGVKAFYDQYYFTAVSPLGFTQGGKNLNYYDDKELIKSITPFSVACFEKQLSWGMHTSVAYCLGEGVNFKWLNKLNETYHFFDKIEPLPHPRFIMQYKLKQKQAYIAKYLNAFLTYQDNGVIQ